MESTKIVVSSEDELRAKMNSSDKDEAVSAINAILTGNVEIGKVEEAQAAQAGVETQMAEPSLGGDTREVVGDDSASGEQKPKSELEEAIARKEAEYKAELDRKEMELEEVRRKEREERDRLQAQLRAEKEQRDAIEAARTKLEETIRKQKAVEENSSDDDDDQYASEYSKRTRQELKKIEQKLESLKNGTSDPELKSLVDEIREYRRVQKENEEAKAKSEKRQKMFDELRRFQESYEEFRTNEPLDVIDDKFVEFKKKVATMINARSVGEVELAVNDILHGKSTRADKLREQAIAKDINPPEEWQKYLSVSDLINEKNGDRYNSATGQYEPILDSEGKKVRYRSVDEVYRIKHFNDAVSKARAEAAREFQSVRERRDNSAISLRNDSSSQVDDAKRQMTQERIRELLNIPTSTLRNNPELASEVALAYRMMGLEAPNIRGGM